MLILIIFCNLFDVKLATTYIKNLIFGDFRSRKNILQTFSSPFLHFLAPPNLFLLMLHLPQDVENTKFAKTNSGAPKNVKAGLKMFAKYFSVIENHQKLNFWCAVLLFFYYIFILIFVDKYRSLPPPICRKTNTSIMHLSRKYKKCQKNKKKNSKKTLSPHFRIFFIILFVCFCDIGFIMYWSAHDAFFSNCGARFLWAALFRQKNRAEPVLAFCSIYYV